MENKKNEQTPILSNMDVFKGSLPDLQAADVAPLELTGEYWSPEIEGETRRMFFNEIRIEKAGDMQSGNDIDLPVAYFVEVINGDNHVVRQASRRLTAVFEAFADRIPPGSPFEITFLGKRKNKTNQFLSDHWSIKPLTLK